MFDACCLNLYKVFSNVMHLSFQLMSSLEEAILLEVLDDAEEGEGDGGRLLDIFVKQ